MLFVYDWNLFPTTTKNTNKLEMQGIIKPYARKTNKRSFVGNNNTNIIQDVTSTLHYDNKWLMTAFYNAFSSHNKMGISFICWGCSIIMNGGRVRDTCFGAYNNFSHVWNNYVFRNMIQFLMWYDVWYLLLPLVMKHDRIW